MQVIGSGSGSFGNNVLTATVVIAALGSALVGGVLYAFSTFVMAALARLPAPQGIAAMQSINVVVINPLFMGMFLGTAALCIGLAIASMLAWNPGVAPYLLAGSAAYLVGTIAVTMVCNVPMNDRLAALDPGTAEASNYWAQYLHTWLRWNHVRTGAALAAAAILVVRLSIGPGWLGRG